MTSYKLTYFNLRARGELARLIFAAADVKYDDVRIYDEVEEWPKLKPTTPFGQLPILEFEGIKMCQSISIARLLARRFNLAGKTELDQVRTDMLVDCMLDSVNFLWSDEFFYCSEKDKKEEMKRQYLDKLPVYLTNLEALLKQNNNGDGFFVGDELTWADLAFIDIVSAFVPNGGDKLLPNYPKLLAAKERIEKLPKIAAWIVKRPVTEV